MVQETPDNVIIEHLKRLRAEHQEFKGYFRDIIDRLSVMDGHMLAFMRHEKYAMDKFAELETRVERIESRLELSDR
ncbi:MAG: hypothetical protein HY053_08360 [Proteobacteria bacterium]|nr:hypothetical protein [Pseudomonadota bacterium]